MQLQKASFEAGLCKILRMLPRVLEANEKAEYQGIVFYIKYFGHQNIWYNGDCRVVEM